MLIVALTLVVVVQLSIAIIAQSEVAKTKSDELGSILVAEGDALAIAIALHSGMEMHAILDTSYSIEGGKFHANYAGKTIEVSGVFEDAKFEPV